MATHSESFSYSNWSITYDPHTSHLDMYSSGTATKTSSRFLLNHLSGTLSATVYGGFGWVAGQYDMVEELSSLKCDLTVGVYLVKSNGTRTLVKSATGSGYDDGTGTHSGYNNRTSASLTYTPTAAERAAYTYFEVVFTCTTSDSSISQRRNDAFENHNLANPSGTCSFNIRDNINVVFVHGGTSTTMTDLIEDGTDIQSLRYNGSVIY